ncbi:hypothetical protein XENTR_v10002855 [Xenopus tropicalis]|nr:hypothetical protein XENTR_v10002855 [Xenopus tropicalis]
MGALALERVKVQGKMDGGPGSNTWVHGALLTYMRQIIIITHIHCTDITNPTQLALSALINAHKIIFFIPWILQYNGRIFFTTINI